MFTQFVRKTHDCVLKLYLYLVNLLLLIAHDLWTLEKVIRIHNWLSWCENYLRIPKINFQNCSFRFLLFEKLFWPDLGCITFVGQCNFWNKICTNLWCFPCRILWINSTFNSCFFPVSIVILHSGCVFLNQNYIYYKRLSAWVFLRLFLE